MHRVQAVRKRHKVPGCRHEQELGHASVQAQPAATTRDRGQVGTVAVGLEPCAASAAASAAPRPHDRDGLAHLRPAHAVAELVHPAGVLMPEREGRGPRQRPGVNSYIR